MITPNFVLGQSIDYVLSRPENFIKLYINSLLEFVNDKLDHDPIWVLEKFIKFIGYTLFKICQNEDDELLLLMLMKHPVPNPNGTITHLPQEIAEKIVENFRDMRGPNATICTTDECRKLRYCKDTSALLQIFTKNEEFMYFTDEVDLEIETNTKKTIGGKRKLKRKNTKRNKNKKRITKRKR